jgi:CHAD domain-containing protein
VAVRRLRSAVSSLKEMLSAEDRRWVNEELRWLGQALGQARNRDVFATELVPAARARMPDEGGWDQLAATLDRLRGAAHDRVRDAVLSQRYAAAMLGLLRWFEVSCQKTFPPTSKLSVIVRPLLDRRRRKVRQRSKGFGRLNPRERHKFRIAAKKLRYTIEVFGDLFPKRRLQPYTKKLKRLQDDLGYANDVRVAHDFLAELFSQVDPRGSAGHAWIEVLEWHDQQLANGEQKLRRRLRRLTRAAPFWRAR